MGKGAQRPSVRFFVFVLVVDKSIIPSQKIPWSNFGVVSQPVLTIIQPGSHVHTPRRRPKSTDVPEARDSTLPRTPRNACPLVPFLLFPSPSSPHEKNGGRRPCCSGAGGSRATGMVEHAREERDDDLPQGRFPDGTPTLTRLLPLHERNEP